MNLYLNTKFKDLKIIKNKYYKDVRGEILFGLVSNNIKRKFVYEYTSTSKKNVFRGFHYQTKRMQGKLITVLNGSIIDCVIDLKSQKLIKKISKFYFQVKIKNLFIFLLDLLTDIMLEKMILLLIVNKQIFILLNMKEEFFGMIKILN